MNRNSWNYSVCKCYCEYISSLEIDITKLFFVQMLLHLKRFDSKHNITYGDSIDQTAKFDQQQIGWKILKERRCFLDLLVSPKFAILGITARFSTKTSREQKIFAEKFSEHKYQISLKIVTFQIRQEETR